jgi:hypothetical protein
VTASLPSDVQAVFQRFITTEYTTVDGSGPPITWPVTPYYEPDAACIDVTTGLGYPKKAGDARANPLVSLLFSDPTGSGLSDAPMVLVQGSAEVDDRDLDANRRRYVREASAKLPATAKLMPPEAIQTRMASYFARIYVHVRPERVYVWPRGDLTTEPQLYDAHMEEVRSSHSEEPERFHASPAGGATAWDPRIEELGTGYPTAVLSIVSPDGFPDFTWQTNFQVRGDLQRDSAGWALVPHKLVGGFELPKSKLASLRANFGKARRYHRVAKRELARRR